MKKCNKCQELKGEREFSKKASATNGLQCYCKICASKVVCGHYANNPVYKQKIKDNFKARKQVNRIKMYKYMLQHPCIDCGESNPIVLDFDHRNLKEKKYLVSTLARMSVAWETVEDEIKKCDMRCSNCHRKRSSKQFNQHKVLEIAKQELLNGSEALIV